MSVYKRGEPKPLETFQYEHITFFGASSICTYKIIVDEREMFFEAPLVRVQLLEYFHINFFLFIVDYCYNIWQSDILCAVTCLVAVCRVSYTIMFLAGFVVVDSEQNCQTFLQTKLLVGQVLKDLHFKPKNSK